jgi:SAM-dependent methyltransferase
VTDRPDVSPPDQIEYWNGPTASRWVAAQAELDRMLAPFGDALLAEARPAPGERAVDIGCGCGETTLALAAAVGPAGAAVGLDVSAPMLARARERAAGLSAATFVEADAATYRLAPPADLVVSRFGVMFFEDPAAALANVRGLLRPGGRLVFVCWRALGDNPWAVLPLEAASSALGTPAAPLDAEGPGPFAFADGARIRRLLDAAGFESITIDPLDHDVVLGHRLDEAAAFVLMVGPTARLCAAVDEAARSRVEGAIREVLAPHARSAGVTLGAAAWLVGARRGRSS